MKTISLALILISKRDFDSLIFCYKNDCLACEIHDEMDDITRLKFISIERTHNKSPLNLSVI